MSYGGFCPKKVYRCPHLTNIITQISVRDIRRLDDIRRAVEDIHQGAIVNQSIQFALTTTKKTQCFLAKHI